MNRLDQQTATMFSPYRLGYRAPARYTSSLSTVSIGGGGQTPSDDATLPVTDLALREGEAGPLGISTTTWLVIAGGAVVVYLASRKRKA